MSFTLRLDDVPDHVRYCMGDSGTNPDPAALPSVSNEYPKHAGMLPRPRVAAPRHAKRANRKYRASAVSPSLGSCRGTWDTKRSEPGVVEISTPSWPEGDDDERESRGSCRYSSAPDIEM